MQPDWDVQSTPGLYTRKLPMLYTLPLSGIDGKKLNELRDRSLPTFLFRDNMHHFGGRLYAHSINCCNLSPDDLYAVAVMRAGWGLCWGAALNNYRGEIGMIDAHRDEATWIPEINMFKCRHDLSKHEVMMHETMLATGGSLSLSTNLLKERSRPRRIVVNVLLAAPEGIARMEKDHPDVDIVVACVDERLDDDGYIVPGLGDAGDRYFGPAK